jgi:hypothetical protein
MASAPFTEKLGDARRQGVPEAKHSTMPRASSHVDAFGTVGPDAVTSKGLPTASLCTTVTRQVAPQDAPDRLLHHVGVLADRI